MREAFTICDVEGCKHQNAKHFNFFKDRRMDGAGSGENWYYGFDLCPFHQEKFLISLFSSFERWSKPIDREYIRQQLENMKVNVREE